MFYDCHGYGTGIMVDEKPRNVNLLNDWDRVVLGYGGKVLYRSVSGSTRHNTVHITRYEGLNIKYITSIYFCNILSIC